MDICFPQGLWKVLLSRVNPEVEDGRYVLTGEFRSCGVPVEWKATKNSSLFL